METKTVKTIDEYVAGFPQDIQKLLTEVRQTIQNSAPNAAEAIKYGMPTFTLNGNLVHFAAFKNHIGFYPTPSAIRAFDKELEAYKRSKGAVQFPYSGQLPHELISRMVQFRVKENTK
jgi:uncharacterized protein YdhG (YjbR/CyaY superfamily)